ncbi:MAG: non-homologous end-joining DNA ligase [Geodermatophilaceae bacterium]
MHAITSHRIAALRPMLATPAATLSREAEDRLWGYEFKWDGIRALGHVHEGTLTLVSRNDRDISAGYPDVAALGSASGAGDTSLHDTALNDTALNDTVLDGELVAFDAAGRPSFSALQQRMHVRDRAALVHLVEQVPVTYLLFDILTLRGRSLLSEPYRARREVLEGLGLQGPSWQTPPYFSGDGPAILAASVSSGLEGVVAKRLDSTYQPGQRSPYWLKIKNMRTQDVVVGGWKPGQGRRSGLPGSLLLGLPGPGGLQYIGKVGTGFTDRALAQIAASLAELAQTGSPFVEVPREHARDAHWVAPALVGEVEFVEWTPEGRLRHPSWRGLRQDIPVQDVRRAEL